MTVLILLLCLSGCSNKDKQAFYGVYTFDKVRYLPPLSSSTIGFVNEYFKGTKYTIEKDLFKIENPDLIEIKSPNYVKEAISENITELSNVRSFIGNDEIEYQYTIYNNDGNKTYYRLYILSDCVLIALYQDKPSINGSDIMNIYKLSN